MAVVFTIAVLTILLFFNGCVISSSTLVKNDVKLVIDEDGGSDDAMAIFMALLYEKYFNGPELVALTTVHGNVKEDQVFYNTQRLLDIANRRDVPIYRGSNFSLVIDEPLSHYFGVDGLGDTSYHASFTPIAEKSGHAAVALIELSKKYQGELIVVTIGSLTNVALAIKLDPQFIGRLKQLYVAAGNGLDLSAPEFNVLMDVEAYHTVAGAGVPDKVTFVPFSRVNASLSVSKISFDQTNNFFFATTNRTPAETQYRQDWRENVLGAIETEIMKSLNAFEQLTIDLTDYWSNLDPMAVSVVLNHTLIEGTSFAKSTVGLCGATRGIDSNELVPEEKANVRLINGINGDLFKKFLLQVFKSEFS